MRLPKLSESVNRMASSNIYAYTQKKTILPLGGCPECPPGTSPCVGDLDLCGNCCRPGCCQIFAGNGTCTC